MRTDGQGRRERRDLIALVQGGRPRKRLGPFQASDEPVLRTGEVAVLFRVTSRAVRSWADAGKLACVRTPGGQRMFLASSVRAVLDAMEKVES